MYFRVAADALLLLHLAFILFAVFGGAFAARWRWTPALHLPAVAWAVFVELSGRICPLTYLENSLRRSAGQSGYTGDFVQHYLLALIYPAGLTREIQFMLVTAVAAINIAIYVSARELSRSKAVHHHGRKTLGGKYSCGNSGGTSRHARFSS